MNHIKRWLDSRRKHPAQRMADVVVKMIERDVNAPAEDFKQFRVVSCDFAPYVSYDPRDEGFGQMPSGLEIQVSIRAVARRD